MDKFNRTKSPLMQYIFFNKKNSSAALLGLMLSACTVGPDYVKPVASTPTQFKEMQGWKTAQPQDEMPRGQWWQIYQDSELNALVEQVQINNQTLKAAEANYRQAIALMQQSRAGHFPTVTGGVSGTRSKPASNASNVQNYNPNINTAYRANLGLAWEADVWGKISRSVEAARAGAQASKGDLANALLSAQATLVQNYLQLRVVDAQIQLLQDTVKDFEQNLRLTQNQYNVGIVSRADVVNISAQLKSTQAQAIDLRSQRATLEHAIAVLIGKAPAEFSIAEAPQVALPVPASVPVTQPSVLLERRPDIAAAERRMQQANANIGVAQAAYYPSLTLSASLGYQSTSFAQWLTLPARFWSLGSALAQTIFDGGLRKAQKQSAIAAYDASVADYRQTILTAFQEVEDNLAALKVLAEEAQVQDSAVEDAEKAAIIARNQYRAGLTSYLNVVTAENAALSSKRTALTIKNNRLLATVNLIKAMGGGWHNDLQTN